MDVARGVEVHGVKINDFCFHKYSHIQNACLSVFHVNSDNKREDLQCIVLSIVLRAVVSENNHGKGM